MPRGVKRTDVHLRMGKDFLMWLEALIEKLPDRITVQDNGCHSYMSRGTKYPPAAKYTQSKGVEFSFRVSRLIIAWRHGPKMLRKGHQLVAMHLCDNDWCVNPDHLKMGTQQENVQDCVAKGRRRGPAKHYA